MLVVGTRQRVVNRRLWGVVLPLVVVGLFGGLAYRVMTGAVYGANIGAGMVILITPGVVLLGLGWATATLVVIARCVATRTMAIGAGRSRHFGQPGRQVPVQS